MSELATTRIALPTVVTLNVQLGGPESGEAILFLHGFPESHRTWRHQLRDLARETADYFAFVDEAKLAAPVGGDSEFQKTFEQTGPRDRRGRSLRALDLQTRLFAYRCSYMIYSPAFDALLPEAKAAVFARLREVVTDRETLEILDETKAGWR